MARNGGRQPADAVHSRASRGRRYAPTLTEIASGDLFLQKINDSPELTGPENYKPVEVDSRLLESMRLEEVFVDDLTAYCAKLPRRYFKNMVPEIPLTQCEKCSHIFLLDEYEFAFLEKKCCPFCRCKGSDADQLMEDTDTSSQSPQ